MYRGLAAFDAASALCSIPRIFMEKAGLIMVTVVLIRQDEPEDKMLFPSARRSRKKYSEPFDIFPLFVYDEFYMLNSDRTSVRHVRVPKS